MAVARRFLCARYDAEPNKGAIDGPIALFAATGGVLSLFGRMYYASLHAHARDDGAWQEDHDPGHAMSGGH